MAFISSSKTNSGKSEVPTVQGVSTTSVQPASVQVSTASTDVAAANLSYDIVCAFIATQPNGSQIKYEDITQIDDDDDIKEIGIKWNLALLSMMADRFWKKTGKKITIQGSDVAGFDKSKDWIYMAEENENHALVADEEEVPIEYALMAKSSSSSDNEIKIKKGLRFNEYSVVPPPPAQVYSPPKKDLSWIGLPEFFDDTVTDYSRPTPSVDVSKDVSASSLEQGGSLDNVVSKPMIRKQTVKYVEMYMNTSQSPKVRSNNFSPPIIEDWDSDDESEIESTSNKTNRPRIEQVKMNQSTREIVEKKELSKQNKNHPRGNQRNWNNQKSQQLGKDFVMQNKACYNCGSFEHLKFDCKQNIWVDKGKTWSRVNHDHDNMKYPSKPTLNCAHSKMTSLVKPAHSHVKRPFVRKTTVKNKVWVPTVRTKFPTVGPKVPTAKPTVAADKGNRGKAVKASACWIWKPKQNQPDQGSNLNGVSGIPQDNIDDKGYWDSGCSRHMTGNISYLSEYEPYNGGYVSFGHGGGMITGKGTIKTGKLEFENVYFVKELKYNLFSVSQICDNKNSVLFTDSECLVLGYFEDANQAMKENVSSLRFITLPNWFHEDQMATSNYFTRNSDAFSEKDDSQKEQDRIINNTDVSESSRNTNPSAITKVPTANQVEPIISLTVETEVPTVSSLVPPISSSGPRIISRGV
ncbi:ribonuclease H-like domain-containing protein [Tanacetum coccineum]